MIVVCDTNVITSAATKHSAPAGSVIWRIKSGLKEEYIGWKSNFLKLMYKKLIVYVKGRVSWASKSGVSNSRWREVLERPGNLG